MQRNDKGRELEKMASAPASHWFPSPEPLSGWEANYTSKSVTEVKKQIEVKKNAELKSEWF